MSLLHALTIAVVMEDVMEEEYANVCQDLQKLTVLPDFKGKYINKNIFLTLISNIIKKKLFFPKFNKFCLFVYLSIIYVRFNYDKKFYNKIKFYNKFNFL
jgi:hypothetical protein